MELTRLLVGADLRHRWRSWLVIVVLVGVLAGVALAAFAGWRRTTTAMDRFLESHRPYNGYVEGHLDRASLLDIPGVRAATGGDYFLLVPLDDDGRPRPELLGTVSPFSYDDPGAFRLASRPIVVAGRLSDPAVAEEVVVDEDMADLLSLEVGSRFSMQGYGMDQAEDLFEGVGTFPPTGPVVELLVTGVIRAPQDVVPGPDVPDVVYLGHAEVDLGPAFDEAHRGKDVASLGYLFGDRGPAGTQGFELRFDPAVTTRDEVAAAVQALDPEAVVDFSAGDSERARIDARQAIGLQAGLVLAMGLLVVASGIVLVSLALRRHLDTDLALADALRDLGLDRRAAVRVAVVKGVALGAAGAVAAVLVAVALSPLTPIGYARRAEIDPGVAVDLWVLGPGALLVGLLVGLRVVVPAARRTSSTGRAAATGLSSLGVRLSERAARWGLPPAAVAGVRAAALSAGAGTVVATVFAATLGSVGSLGFASSEARLAGDPALWGWTFDLVVGDGNDPQIGTRADERFEGDPTVEAYSVVHDIEVASVRTGDRSVDVTLAALEPRRGAIQPEVLEGRPPAADDEVALGGATADRLGVGVGDEVRLELGDEPVPFTVSGVAVMNWGYDAERIGEGALVTPAGLEAAGSELDPRLVLVDLADGVDPDAAYAAMREDWGSTVLRPIRTSDVERLHAVRQLPVWFSALVAAVAAVTLAFVLTLTIRARRRDLALLRTLGFDRRQLRSTVALQATALVLPAALAGALMGVAGGRVAWAATVRGMGAPLVHVTPLAALALVVAGSLLVALVVAVAPARFAARTRPAQVLRTE